ncbi:MAG: PAS domain S-box protein [Gemmatimonadota bacterium]|nr:MAG: PAS domain S-box protein [Gemmatimonadota bacterium]
MIGKIDTASRQPPGSAKLAGNDGLVRLLLSSTGEGIYGIDLEGKCTFANPACLRLLGFESDTELLGRNMHQLVHHTRPDGEPYPEKECHIYRAFREGKGTHVDDEVMWRADGSSFPTEYWSYPMERDGELMGCVLTFVDISERRRQEQLLAEQAANLAEVARFPEMNPGPVLRVDLDGTVLMDNPAARDLFGQELLGQSWRAVCPGIDETVWHDILEVRGAVVLERCITGRDFLFTHRRDFEANLVFVFGADVTEQKQAERALRQADELVRLLLDSTGEGIYGVDLQGNCTFANPACAKLLGFETVDELLGKQMHELVHHTRPNGEPYPVEECQIYKAFREHRGTHVDDEVMFCSDGKPFPAEYWSYPVERDGALVGCVVTFVDITERRRVEEEMRQTEKMAALGKLSAGLAHELNNPAAAAQRASGQLANGLDELQAATVELTRAGIAPGAWDAVIEWAREFRDRADGSFDLSALEASDREEELIDWLEAHGVEEAWTMASTLVNAGVRKDDLDAIAAGLPTAPLGAVVLWLCRAVTVQELTGVVARSTKSISDLVNVVKSYSYMDQAPLQYVDIHAGLEDTLTILGHKLRRGIEVVKQYDRSLPRVQVQGSELNQVWTNLIDNAIGAMGERGTITIKTYRDDQHLMVEIADDGPGIPEKIQPRIFDPFFTTKGVGEGTGLGLDVARRIVTARCGGQIDFSSRPGATVFRVRLPVQSAGTPES